MAVNVAPIIRENSAPVNKILDQVFQRKDLQTKIDSLVVSLFDEFKMVYQTRESIGATSCFSIRRRVVYSMYNNKTDWIFRDLLYKGTRKYRLTDNEYSSLRAPFDSRILGIVVERLNKKIQEGRLSAKVSVESEKLLYEPVVSIYKSFRPQERPAMILSFALLSPILVPVFAGIYYWTKSAYGPDCYNIVISKDAEHSAHLGTIKKNICNRFLSDPTVKSKIDSRANDIWNRFSKTIRERRDVKLTSLYTSKAFIENKEVEKVDVVDRIWKSCQFDKIPVDRPCSKKELKRACLEKFARSIQKKLNEKIRNDETIQAEAILYSSRFGNCTYSFELKESA